jgi:CBS domain-containing protein
MLCKDVMSYDIKSIKREANVMEAALMMSRFNVGLLPVSENGSLVGVLTDRDIAIRAVAAGKHPQEVTVGEMMTPNFVVCYEDQSLDEAARLMEDQQMRRLLVVNRNKELVGVLSLGDLAVSRSDDHIARQTLKGVSEERI